MGAQNLNYILSLCLSPSPPRFSLPPSLPAFLLCLLEIGPNLLHCSISPTLFKKILFWVGLQLVSLSVTVPDWFSHFNCSVLYLQFHKCFSLLLFFLLGNLDITETHEEKCNNYLYSQFLQLIFVNVLLNWFSIIIFEEIEIYYCPASTSHPILLCLQGLLLKRFFFWCI